MRQYVPELDGLRTLAVVSVVLFHAAPHGMFSGGFIGVDLFFVLSAFLITSILAEGGDLKLFYWRRFCRLMPALLFMLAGYLLAAPFVWPSYHHGNDALLAGLYLSDYTYAFLRVPLYLQHTWSLAVEEHFYLLWPLLLVPLSRSKQPLAWLAGAYVLATLWRASSGDWQSYYYRFDTHCTGLILGAALFFARPPRISPSMAWAALAVLTAILLLGDIRFSALTITAAEIAAAILIAAPPRWAGHPSLVWLGKRSYAIYLWHFPFAYAVRPELAFAWTALLTLAFSISMAAISYATVEALGRQLRDRVEARRRVEV